MIVVGKLVGNVCSSVVSVVGLFVDVLIVMSVGCLCVGVGFGGMSVMEWFLSSWLIWLIFVSSVCGDVLVDSLSVSVGVLIVLSVLVFIVLYIDDVFVLMFVVMIRIVYGVCVMIWCVVVMLLIFGIMRFISMMLGGCVM